LTQALPRAERLRQGATSRDVLANIFFAAWVCVILQGALRKWAFPGLQILYLIQDFPLVIAYIYALYKGLFWAGWLAWACIIGSMLLCVQGLWQVIAIDLSLTTAVIGLHHYIIYLPILFIAPVCFNQKHRRRFLRFNLLCTIPMAAIAALQARSPQSAWINRTSAGNTAFSIAGSDAFRASGTFNFALPFALWCGIVVSLVIGEWLQPKSQRSFKSSLLLLACTISACIATAVSGSRSALAGAGIAFLGGLLSVAIMRKTTYIVNFLAIMILLPILGGLAYLVAPASVMGNLNRFSGESNKRDLVGRVEAMTVGFITEPPFSIIGRGVGTGIQAANVESTDAYTVNLSENDTTRAVQELGTITGVALVLARYFGAITVAFLGLRALRQTPSFPYGLPLALSTVPTLAFGDIWRVAPQVATQAFFCIAFLMGAILFRREALSSETLQQFRTR
jgi:hypothetical protein